jgi:hypothetical protein
VSVASLRSPFLSQDSHVAIDREAPAVPRRAALLPARSPFLALYDAGGESLVNQPLREAFAALVDELHDEEFDEAMAGVHAAARAFHDHQLATGRPREVADRLLVQRFEPLLRETGAMVDALSEQFAPHEGAGIEEHEIDRFADGYVPREALDPEFEQFFGKLVRKVKKAAKAVAGKALRGIAQLGLAPAMRAIKSHLQAFLKRALQRVMGRLPTAVQPYARKLAQRLGFALPAPAPASVAEPIAAPAAPVADAATPADAGAPTLPDPAGNEVGTQQELDEQLAGALLATDEAELEFELAAFEHEAEAAAPPVFATLDDARERFIDDLQSLKEGESPEPAIQDFLPAVLPALGIVSKIVGRQRLVNTVAGLLAPLVGRLIGPEGSAALSRSIADLGLRALNLEAPENDAVDEAESPQPAAAVAATVEEAMARIATLPAELHDDRELFEAFALEAFEAAAAANLPALFPEATYRQRPELLEAGLNVAWPLLPRSGGPRRYKRCSGRFRVALTPHMAGEIESFEGAPLADHLHDQLGLADAGALEAEVALYESLPGTTLADIARGEREWLGAGASEEANAAQLHPLTPHAAAVLLGKPGLGRAWRAGSRHRPLAAGQRFYALRVAGALPATQHRRPLHLRLTLDLVHGELRACVFVSEVKAQKLAVQLRQQAGAGTLATQFDRWIARRLWHQLFGHARHRARIVHANLPPGGGVAQRLQQVPPAAAQALLRRLRTWLVGAYAEGLKAQSAAIVAATEHAADGITLRFTVAAAPGLKELGALLEGKGTADALGQALAAPAPKVALAIAPGHACG